ncbi:acyltransferase-like protein At3g26840, chloroplastic isoform X2 [Pistacia vera]|uniref:acyltransferase-like protein At3g26840, chloroplastic isoform X2 n=1 Tax=Pistacia vera TaxID=55513 RepID=UPI0012633468|nr:acyltransferase-like protein At3g26840, chloroplastic isoform X2 [Pistacia vera]
MAMAGAFFFSADLSPLFRRDMMSASGKTKRSPILKRLAASTEQRPSPTTVRTKTARERSSSFVEKKSSSEEVERIRGVNVEDEPERNRKSFKDYFEEAKDMIRSDGGPPRWFSPLECGSHAPDSPLLLYLSGMDGVGVGLVTQHQRLGQIFDIWCLHIPVKDRTSFTGLVKLVERTVRSENYLLPNRPIYLVGESLGACLALAVAARNPDIDLVLILANPATSFSKSQFQPLIPLLELMPHQVPLILLSVLSLMEETLRWKLEMLKSASAYANSRLHAVKAQTLILSSGRDQLLPSREEGERLRLALSHCQIRRFNDSRHALFLEDDFDLVTVIKGAGFYRCGKYLDYISDFIPPTPSEFKKTFESDRWIYVATAPVMLSTLEDGKIVKGLAGIPSEGPVLFVGYHMLLGLELTPLVSQFMIERNIVLRGIAHPMMFKKLKDGKLPELSQYDKIRIMGAVPVSGTNFFKLLSSKSHVLLYPGGMREALHRKGEEYKLFWPEQSEFVRMAARFGAKIVPFGAVGEDDIGQVVFDYDDLMKIPYFRNEINELTSEAVHLRTDASGEVANQDVHLPGILPKVPGRFYYYFGKPIETAGRKQELRDRKKCHELYLEVKSEVEKCISYLKEKRESDPYRNLLPRLIYQATHGFTSEVPTFEP